MNLKTQLVISFALLLAANLALTGILAWSASNIDPYHRMLRAAGRDVAHLQELQTAVAQGVQSTAELVRRRAMEEADAARTHLGVARQSLAKLTSDREGATTAARPAVEPTLQAAIQLALDRIERAICAGASGDWAGASQYFPGAQETFERDVAGGLERAIGIARSREQLREAELQTVIGGLRRRAMFGIVVAFLVGTVSCWTLFRSIGERERVQREKEALLERLAETSRHVGMAEVATGVLHNVGNVLNSVNVAANCMADRLRNSRIAGLVKTNALLDQHQHDLPEFLAHDERGKRLPGYLQKLCAQLVGEQSALSDQLAELNENIEHIKEIVAMQQAFSRLSGAEQEVHPIELIEDAIKLNSAGLMRHGAELIRDLDYGLPLIKTDRHKVLQILVNLISNAKQAVSHADVRARTVTVRVRQLDDAILFEVADTGVGIAKQNLAKIFSHGFTTKRDGHGFGLHSAALAARALGGSLTVYSAGPGAGAQFTLRLPVGPQAAISIAEEQFQCAV
jgi:signal transduction histidine kinase